MLCHHTCAPGKARNVLVLDLNLVASQDVLQTPKAGATDDPHLGVHVAKLGFDVCDSILKGLHLSSVVEEEQMWIN